MSRRKWPQLALGVLLAVVFLWLLFRQVNPEEIKTIFVSAHLAAIMAALVAFAVGYSCRIERWRVMLKRHSSTLKWTGCAGPLLASFAVNNVLPFRAGDVLRAFAFNQRLGASSSVVIATLFVERMLDLLIILAVLGVALSFFAVNVSSVAGVSGAVVFMAAAAILPLLCMPHLLVSPVRRLARAVLRFSPQRGRKLLEEIDKSLTTLQYLGTRHTLIRLLGWSLLAWIAEGCVFWFGALALSSIAAPSASWLALPLGTLATLIPSTPGYVGTFDYFTVRAMTELGNSTSAATAYALLVHGLLWLPPTLIGGVYLLILRLNPAGRLKWMRS